MPIHAKDGNLTIALKNGIALGSALRFTPGPSEPEFPAFSLVNSTVAKEPNGHDFLLCSTFVSDAMLGESQRKLKAKILRQASKH